MSFIYVASPYSHIDEEVREQRFASARNFVASFLKNEYRPRHAIYSPIVHFHEVAKVHGLGKDFKFWQIQNRKMIIQASILFVLKISGWQTSKGVTAERDWARNYGIPSFFWYESANHWVKEGGSIKIEKA